MQRTDMETLIGAIGATAEIMQTQLQPAALKLMAQDLSEYRLSDVLDALKRVRQEVSGPLKLSLIIDRIESADGAPGPDEAWALMSRPEPETVVITEQMAEARQASMALLADGDKTGARMAFKDSYTRILANARKNKVRPKWFVSLGFDVDGRAQPIAEAVRSGKLVLEHSLKLLSPAGKAELLELTGNSDHPFLLEYKQAQLEEKRQIGGKKDFQELKALLRGKA